MRREPRPIPPKPTTQAEFAALYAFALVVERGFMEAHAEREQRRQQRLAAAEGANYVIQTSAADRRG